MVNMMTQDNKDKYTGFVRDVATVNLNDISTEDKWMLFDSLEVEPSGTGGYGSINELKSF